VIVASLRRAGLWSLRGFSTPWAVKASPRRPRGSRIYRCRGWKFVLLHLRQACRRRDVGGFFNRGLLVYNDVARLNGAVNCEVAPALTRRRRWARGVL